MIKILTVVGARPQFVKAAVVSRALSVAGGFDEKIVHTGQHYDANMSSVFFAELGISEPHYNLNVGNVSHAVMTGRIMENLESVIALENPACVMVYGDTNSTLAAALTARKLHKTVAHVEAGLRSFDMRMPEEVNRILTDRISDLLFCPTPAAIENLKAEGYDKFPCRVVDSGDVMFDAALFFLDKIRTQTAHPIVENLRLGDFVLCTVHREENTDDRERLSSIFAALDEIHRQIPVVLPLHPRTEKMLKLFGVKSNVHLIAPVRYLEMLSLLDRCRVVLTDSGGLQKEAFFTRKFCITLRDTTEWTELVAHNVNFLAGSDKEKILELFNKLPNANADFSASLFGNGNAGEIIAENLRRM